ADGLHLSLRVHDDLRRVPAAHAHPLEHADLVARVMAISILSLTIWVPIVFGVVVLAVADDRKPDPARWTALVGSILGLVVALPLWTQFQDTAAMQFVVMEP